MRGDVCFHRQQVPLKLWSPPSAIYDVKSQNTVIFTVVENLTLVYLLFSEKY